MQSTYDPENLTTQSSTDLQPSLLHYQEPAEHPYSLYNQHTSLSLVNSHQAFCNGSEVIVIGFFKSPESNLLDGDGKIFSNLEHNWNDVLDYISSFDDYEIMTLKSKGKSLVH